MATGRRAPRQLANVEGICLLEDELAPDGWQVCWILDLSALGMGLMFRHQHEAELLGRTIAVEVPSAKDSARVPLEGEIKNALMIEPGLVRVGIEFTGERQASKRSLRCSAPWPKRTPRTTWSCSA